MTKRVLSLLAVTSLVASALAADGAQLTVLYPTPFTLCQRETPAEGSIRVRGRYPAGTKLDRVEARFCGREWRVLDPAPKDGRFAGSIREAVGQGTLEVRGVGGPKLAASVSFVGIGDLFIVAGQSNADGRGDAMTRLNPDNPFVGVKYLKDAWSRGDDPSSSSGKYGSPWPIVLNTLIPARKVPVGFIATAVGSTVVRQWRRADGSANWAKDGSMYARMRKIVAAATDGTMKVRAVLYYQGENDLTHWNKLTVMGDYAKYKGHLNAAVTGFWKDLGVPVLVGQITNLGGDRPKNDNIRRAQQETWREHPQALPGAVTFDIYPSDGCHYRTPVNMGAFARRWTAAILAGVYGQRKMASPKLLSIRRQGDRRLVLTYDQPMKLSTWNGKPGDRAQGFRFLENGQPLKALRVVGTKIDGGKVTLELSRPAPAALRVDFGSGRDGQNGVVPRSVANGLPAPMLFAQSVE